MSDIIRFRSTGQSLVGVEYELQMLDAETLDLSEGIIPLLKDPKTGGLVHPEYNQFTIEIATRPCASLPELERHLRTEVGLLVERAREHGLRLSGGGTHPFNTRLAPVTPTARYRRMEREWGFVGYRQVVFGHHVHIGMHDGDEAIAIMQALRPYLPVLLALSASSPYWLGFDTDFASYRSRILSAAHTYGTPPVLASWGEFEKLWQVAGRARMFESFKDMHWDIRPRPDLGTLEIRIMDAAACVSDVIALTALCVALTEYRRRTSKVPRLITELPPWLETEKSVSGCEIRFGGLGHRRRSGRRSPDDGNC